MTAETKGYLISDLTNELGLPRSTINDWLIHYNDFLDAEMHGKRKYYSVKALNILKEIAELRNSGASYFDIEQQLAAKYGIRPEIAAEHKSASSESAPPAEAGSSPSNSVSALTTAGNNPPNWEGALPVLRPAMEELSTKFLQEFRDLAHHFESQEEEHKRSLRRMRLFICLLLTGALILLLLLATMLMGVKKQLQDSERQRAVSTAEWATASANLNTQNEKLAAQITQLGQERRQQDAENKKQTALLTDLLNESKRDFNEQVSKLEAKLAAQRQLLEEQLKKLEEEARTKTEAEVTLVKTKLEKEHQAQLNSLAAEHQKELQQAAQKADLANSSELTKLKQELEQQQLQLKERQQQLEQLSSQNSKLEQYQQQFKEQQQELETRQKELEQLRSRLKELEKLNSERELPPKQEESTLP